MNDKEFGVDGLLVELVVLCACKSCTSCLVGPWEVSLHKFACVPLPTSYSLTWLNQAQSLVCDFALTKRLQPLPSKDLWPVSSVVQGTCLTLARNHKIAETL